MKAFSKLLVAGLIMFGLLSCSKDENPDNRDNRQTNESIYLSFKLEFPATRSSTGDDGGSNDGTELGTVAENKVGSVKIILQDPTQPTGTDIIDSNVGVLSISSGTTMYTVKFKSDALAGLADEDNPKNVNVYAYCNPHTSANTVNNLDDEFTPTALADAGAIWEDNKFFMSNAEMTIATLPKKEVLNQHNTPENPLNIGTINVERAAARFDIAKNKDFNLTDDDAGQNVHIELKNIALFNMSKACYNFRRVSADGTSTSWQICGKETKTNYVVDTDWENKVAGTDNFFYTKFADLEWKAISELSVSDNNTSLTTEYYPWRYAIENAIPADKDAENITTGVAFQGVITANDGCETSLKNEIDAHSETLYVFDNVLYGSWARVGRAANKGFVNGSDGATFKQNDVLEAAYDAVTHHPRYEANKDSVARQNGFKTFAPVSGEYKVYYNYYNRHNDNGNPNTTGSMEFAVVRNNVYKLAVTSITGFGDNEWQEPGDNPIESDEKYFAVTVRVLPWVVRVNDIVF